MASRRPTLNFVTSDSGLLVPTVTDDPVNDRTDITYDIAPSTSDGWVITSEAGVVGYAPAVRSIAKTGDTELHGDVTLTGGANMTLTQTGQDIEFAATITGGGAVDSLAAAGDTPMVGNLEIAAGTGIAVTQNDVDTLTIAATLPGSKKYLNKPAGNITRNGTTVAAFSTAWQITGVVVASGENVQLTVSASAKGSTANADFLLALFRGSTQIASCIFTSAAASTSNHRPFTWIDENPGAGTYTYEVRAAQFTSGTLTVYQTNITTDVDGGTSIFIAEVYKP